MDRRSNIKEKIKNDILAFKPAVTIYRLDAVSILNEVFRESPQLLTYITDYTASGFLGGMRFEFNYGNRDIPQKNIFVAENALQHEKALKYALEKYLDKIVVLASEDIDLSNEYNAFLVTYKAYYSNLLDIEVALSDIPAVNRQFVVYTFKYRIGRLKLNMMERAVDEEVERLASLLFKENMLPQTKAYIANNYLARTVTYWKKEEPNPLEASYMQSAYGALINKKCVCQGFAEAYKRILDSAGIENDVICGKIRNSQTYHAWNAVSFDGKTFYHIDVTWNAGSGFGKCDTYFGKTDEFMKTDRIWTRNPRIICNGTEDILHTAKKQISENITEYIKSGVPAKFLR